MYIHGADFSTSGYQTLALRLDAGMNLQTPAFSSGTTNIQSNKGSAGKDVHLLFGAKVREQATFRHPHLIRQHAEGNAFDSRLAHQCESLIENALTCGCQIPHEVRIVRPVVLIKEIFRGVHPYPIIYPS